MRDQGGYHVYFLLDHSGQVYYVGRGRGERHRISRYRHPLPDGSPCPVSIKMKDNLTKEQAVKWEKLYLRAHSSTVSNIREEWGSRYVRREGIRRT